MKKRFLEFLERHGIDNINSRHLNVAFIIWLLPMGTLFMAIYIICLALIKKKLKVSLPK
jgi:hypothetical protein